MKYKNVLLKKFGIREVNKMVKGEKIGDLWYVFFFGDWHYVPECDIEFNGKHLNKIKGSKFYENSNILRCRLWKSQGKHDD